MHKPVSAESTGASENPARVISRSGYFTLSFGSMVGSGWIILLGEWLGLAGPGGTLLALLAGGLVMALVGACYAELAARHPLAGGEFLYAMEVLGSRAAFIVGWFITLFLIAVCAFEALVLVWLLQLLIPSLKSQALYTFLGEGVTIDSVLIGLAAIFVISGLNLSGVKLSVLFQRIVTFTFIGIMALLIIAGFGFGDLSNAMPLFDPPGDKSWFLGALWIFASCAMLLNGFQSAIYVIEERSTSVPVRSVVKCMIFGILGATVFYALTVLSASAVSPWQAILGADLPAVLAFGRLTESGVVGQIIIVAAIISLTKTWNAVLMMATRMLLSQARAGLLPKSLARLNRKGAPTTAIYLVTVFSIVGVFLGRGAIIPIINMAIICIAFSFVLSLWILLKLRKQDPTTPEFEVPGGRAGICFALVGAFLMAGFAFLEPLFRAATGVPLEWILMALWAALGVFFSWVAHRKKGL
jgi:amino acid transporter